MSTIGELTNVPVPGSGVQSAWAQDVTNRAVHRFTDVAAMNAWAAGDGSLAFVWPTLYRRVSAGWVAMVDINSLTPINNNLTTLNMQVPYATLGGLPNVTTDGNGDARVTFLANFATIPGVAVVANNLANVQLVTHSVDVTGFSIRAHFFVDVASGGSGNPNTPWTGTTSIGWVASGALLAGEVPK